MSVCKVRYGTPEEIVPTKFAPQPICGISEGLPEDAVKIVYTQSVRGVLLRIPVRSETRIFGFGLQLKEFDHRGSKLYLRPNADPRSPSGDSHAPVPFFVTNEGWGIYVDTARYMTAYCGKYPRPDLIRRDAENDPPKTPLESFYHENFHGADAILSLEIPHTAGVDLYYITGESVGDIVAQYNLLSGGGCMPALWGLGCFYRCDMHFNAEQVLKMAHHFRELDMPCDIIGLEPGWQSCSYSCSFMWDEGRYPDPDGTVKALRDDGFHVNLWEHAFTRSVSPIYNDLIPYSGDHLVWNGLVPDFITDGAKKVFGEHQKTFVRQGVDGFKLDECDGSDFTGCWSFPDCAAFPSGADGEQYHSLFGTLYAETMEEVLGNRRTLSEVRNMGALAASHPFVLYSDLYEHRDFLMGLVNSGFSGILWSPEVRHAENAEDLIRRVQTVIFSTQALVNAFYLDTMPWEQHGCTDTIRELFRLRMSLVPYLYSAFHTYHTTGKPPVRALVCDFGDEEETYSVTDEFLFGDSILVAPLIAPEKERDVFLPRGEWYDFFTKEKYEGGTHHIVTDGIPVFVRAGTLLPVAEPVSHMEKDTCFDITLRAYGNCETAVCRLIEDDGETEDTEYRVIELTEKSHHADSFRYRIKEKIEK